MTSRESRGNGAGSVFRASLCVIGLALSPISLAQRRPLRGGGALGKGLPPALRRALTAQATLRFTGRRTVTVLRNGQPNRHEEIVTRDGPRVRIEFPSGGPYAGQVIVENASERRHFLPKTNEIRLLPPRREEGLQRLRAMARDGRVSVEPGERIAGHATVEATVRNQAGDLVQRLSIEPSSGALLRRRVYDLTGAEVGGFVYTRIDLNTGPLDAALFRIDRKGAHTVTPRDMLLRLARRGKFRAVGLPASTGFRLDSVRLQDASGNPVLVQNYTGPGGRLSLYQLRATVSSDRLRRQAARWHSLSWNEGGLTFVLIGPQDEATLKRLKGTVGN